MKLNARIIYLAHHEKVKEKTLVGGKSFDFILETMSGPKRRIALKIILRPYETFVPFNIHIGQQQCLTYNQKTKEIVCRIKPSHCCYLSKKYRRKFSARSKMLNSYEKEIYEAQVIDCPQHFLKHYQTEMYHLQPCKK
ncbi:MAG: hypothetical protein ACKOWX_01540 [Flavobacteriales bacterium]